MNLLTLTLGILLYLLIGLAFDQAFLESKKHTIIIVLLHPFLILGMGLLVLVTVIYDIVETHQVSQYTNP